MPRRSPLITALAACILVPLAAPASPAQVFRPNTQPPADQPRTPPYPQPDSPNPDPAGRARIEIVFVLDTTGSMGGLIDGAKRKIWSIATSLTQVRPRPEILIGLVAFRDRADSYITRVTPLTSDLDQLYSELMQFRADEGGDEPESVNQALHEALTKSGWCTRDTAARCPTLQVMYLVGDSPPHMDYQDDVKYDRTCSAAAQRGIIINAIQCGTNPRTTPVWLAIASSAGGRFFRLEQSGGVKTVSTPYDAELSRLSTDLEGTLIDYGDAGVMQAQAAKRERQREVAGAAPPGAAADRAVFNSSAAGASNLLGRQELVKDVQDGKVQLKNVPRDQLPGAMQRLSLEEREKYVQDKAAARATIRARIEELSRQRATFLRQALGDDARTDSFDQAVIRSLLEEAQKQGITVPPEK